LILRRLPLHPALLVTAFVLSKAVSEGVDPPGFARPLLVGLGAVATATIFGALVTRSWRGGGLVASLLFLILLSRDPIVWLLRAIRDGFGIVGGTVVLAGLVAVLLVGGGLVLLRLRRRSAPIAVPSAKMASFLNVFGIALVALVMVQAIPQLPSWLPTGLGRVQAEPATPALPDIYLILLDGYPRADVLAGEFSYDNDEFLTGLGERRFYVQQESHSNYTNTALTLPSLLAMDYLTTDESATYTDADLHQRLDAALREGAGLRELRAAGYELVATPAGWEHVSLRAGVDRMLDRPELTDLERFLLRSTWIPDLPGVSEDLFFDELHSRVLGVLSDAASHAERPHDRPQFVFVHVPAPHLPIAFGRDGGHAPYPSRLYQAVSPVQYQMSEEEYQEAYGSAIASLNRLVMDVIDRVVAASEAAPVIVVMSDHGYDGASLSGEDLKLLNYLAASTPGHPGLLDSATPVNVLRLLLGAYAGSDVGEPLPDRYFHTSITDHVTTITETDEPG
jgi:hypothetical protein